MAASSFDCAIAFVFAREGGFADHPRDRGGATNFGITQATLAKARGRAVSVQDVRDLDRGEALAIYRRFYWETVRGDSMPAGIDLALFDFAVHAGPVRAVLCLQDALGIEADGIAGPVTLAAAHRADALTTIHALTQGRLAFLARLSVWLVFGRGWRRRVFAAEREALRLVSQSPHKKGHAMLDTKSMLASRTIWANLIGLLAVLLGAFGFDTSGLDGSAMAEAIVQLVAAVSFLASTFFRLVASKQLLR